MKTSPDLVGLRCARPRPSNQGNKASRSEALPDATTLRIIRPLPAEDQRLRELVLRGPGSVSTLQRVPRPDTLKGGHQAPRSLKTGLAQLNRRVVRLSLKRAGIESALAGVRRRIARLQADADALQAQLSGITLGDATSLFHEQRAIVDLVLLTVTRELSVPVAAVLGRRGIEPVCWARFIALTLACSRANVRPSALARYLRMDDGTVIHALKKTAVLRDACPAFRVQYEQCVAKLEGGL